MSEWVTLLALAFGLYLVECLAWIDSSTWVAFAHPLTRGWRCATGERLPGNERGGIVAVSPLEISGALVACRPWPFSVSPDGVSAAEHYIPFDSIESVATGPTGVLINGQLFVRVSSTPFAVHLTQVIESIRETAPRKRSAAIETAIRRSLDGERAAAVWAAFQQRTRLLLILSSFLFTYLFAVVPTVLVLWGPHPSWQYLLGGLVLATLVTAIAYYRTHVRLYPQCGADRWTHILTMVLLPVGAIRAIDHVSRDALCEFSPVAVAPLLCANDAVIPLLRRYAHDLSTNPVAAGDTTKDAADSGCAEWYRQALSKSVHAALDPLKPVLAAPPPREDASMAGYCPRCHAQFSVERETCGDCAGVRLLTYA